MSLSQIMNKDFYEKLKPTTRKVEIPKFAYGEAKITNRLPVNLLCPICLKIIENSRACHHCLKSFCYECIELCYKHNSLCPKCNGFITMEVLLDTSDQSHEMLVAFAKSQMNKPNATKQEIEDFINELKKKREEELEIMREREEIQEIITQKSLPERVEEYMTRIDELTEEIRRQANKAQITRTVTWGKLMNDTKEICKIAKEDEHNYNLQVLKNFMNENQKKN